MNWKHMTRRQALCYLLSHGYTGETNVSTAYLRKLAHTDQYRRWLERCYNLEPVK